MSLSDEATMMLMDTLEHVWSCPIEPFACSDPLHANATMIVDAWRSKKAESVEGTDLDNAEYRLRRQLDGSTG